MGQPTMPLPPPTAFLRLFWGNVLAARTMGDSPPWTLFWLLSKHTTINLILCILFLFFPSPLLLAWTDLNLLFQIEILS
jgi:hypothetical protein